MLQLNRKNFKQYRKYPERVIQFGEGNFLRCFIDWQIDIINEKGDLDAGVVVVRPIDTENLPLLDIQDGLYTTIIRGINSSRVATEEFRVISSITREIPIYKRFNDYIELAHNPELRFIFSNTTEAGIVFVEKDRYSDKPPSSFPAKLTRLLHERFKKFNGASDKGFIILPCELIEHNAEKLKSIVMQYVELWSLGNGFRQWLNEFNVWCSTLVDRIVTGYPHDSQDELEKKFGYTDRFMVMGEYFHLFVIEGPKELLVRELKLNQVNLNIKIVDDLTPYRSRKVGILNGTHTAMVPVSYLSGMETVADTLNDKVLGKFVEEVIYDELVPALDLEKDELLEFADDVISRFKNPYTNHHLMAIALNSMAKYRTRVLPQLLRYREKQGKLPKKLLFSLSALIKFYKGDRGGEKIELQEDADILVFYRELWSRFERGELDYEGVVDGILKMDRYWGIDLCKIKGLKEQVVEYLKMIDTTGMKEAVKNIL